MILIHNIVIMTSPSDIDTQYSNYDITYIIHNIVIMTSPSDIDTQYSNYDIT